MFLAVAWTTDIHLVRHQHKPRPQHGLRGQYRPQTLAQPSAAAQIKDINRASGATQAMGSNMIPCGNLTHGHQHGFRWQHRPGIST